MKIIKLVILSWMLVAVSCNPIKVVADKNSNEYLFTVLTHDINGEISTIINTCSKSEISRPVEIKQIGLGTNEVEVKIWVKIFSNERINMTRDELKEIPNVIDVLIKRE